MTGSTHRYFQHSIIINTGFQKRTEDDQKVISHILRAIPFYFNSFGKRNVAIHCAGGKLRSLYNCGHLSATFCATEPATAA
jgi:hypothetical protein